MVFNNYRYTKTLLLLAIGKKTRKNLEKNGINASTWENKYKPRLKKDKIIYEKAVRKGKGRWMNVKHYAFNWQLLIKKIEEFIIKDIKKIINDIKVINFKKNSDYYDQFTQLDVFIDEIKRYFKNISEKTKEWLIQELKGYFFTIIRDNLNLDKRTMREIITSHLLACGSNANKEFQDVYYYYGLPPKEIGFGWLDLITNYFDLYYMTPWWIITLWPHTNKDEIMEELNKGALERHYKNTIKEDMKCYSKGAINRTKK